MQTDPGVATIMEERVLIYAPFGRDATIMGEIMAGAGMTVCACHSASQFRNGIAAGGGAAIVAIEALAADELHRLAQILAAQPPWSDFPLIVLFNGRDPLTSKTFMIEALGNVGNLNMLERPLSIESLLNAASLALRARRRQYQARDHMRQLEETKEHLTQASREALLANEAKSRFLAAASHDLRQPFQAMRLFHQMVADALQNQPAHRAALRLGDAITSGEDLLNALLDLSTLEAGVTKVDYSTFALGDVLHTVANDLGAVAHAKGIPLRVRPCVDVTVHSDAVLLKRIIRNLTINAIRYTEQGKVLIGCRKRAGHVRIEVWDTGIGIAADKVGRIFEDFYQVENTERDRSKGIGLGLSIVERMARLLDHKVAVRSIPGRGSVFSVTVAL